MGPLARLCSRMWPIMRFIMRFTLMIYEPIGLTFTVQGYEKKMYAGIVEEAKN